MIFHRQWMPWGFGAARLSQQVINRTIQSVDFCNESNGIPDYFTDMESVLARCDLGVSF